MDEADDLLQRALLNTEACASVALRVSDLPLEKIVGLVHVSLSVASESS